MTKEEFLKYKSDVELCATQIVTKYQHLRYGQSIYNTVAKKHPHIVTNYIVGRNCDPFYNDNNLPEFWNELEKQLVNE